MFGLKKPCSIPGDFNSTFQLAQRIFSFQFSIILLQSSPLARSVIKWSQLENWKCFSPMEKSHQSQGWKIPLFCINFQLSFKKIIIKSLPSPDDDCVQMDYPSCVMQQVKFEVINHYNCSLAFFDNDKNLKICSRNLTLSKIKV